MCVLFWLGCLDYYIALEAYVPCWKKPIMPEFSNNHVQFFLPSPMVLFLKMKVPVSGVFHVTIRNDRVCCNSDEFQYLNLPLYYQGFSLIATQIAIRRGSPVSSIPAVWPPPFTKSVRNIWWHSLCQYVFCEQFLSGWNNTLLGIMFEEVSHKGC